MRIDPNDSGLIRLRDRIGRLNSGEPRDVLQRLTWIWNTREGLVLINRAIDDVQEDRRSD